MFLPYFIIIQTNIPVFYVCNNLHAVLKNITWKNHVPFIDDARHITFNFFNFFIYLFFLFQSLTLFGHFWTCSKGDICLVHSIRLCVSPSKLMSICHFHHFHLFSHLSVNPSFYLTYLPWFCHSNYLSVYTYVSVYIMYTIIVINSSVTILYPVSFECSCHFNKWIQYNIHVIWYTVMKRSKHCLCTKQYMNWQWSMKVWWQGWQEPMATINTVDVDDKDDSGWQWWWLQ